MEQKIFYIDKNKTLCGILNINNPSDKKIVVICHARTSSKDSKPTTMISQELNKNNINNFRFDFISCGESAGTYKDYCVSNMISNLNESLLMLKKEYFYNEFILIGCSMGARIVSLVDYHEHNIVKLILWYGALDYGRGVLNIPSKKELEAKRKGFFQIENGCKLSYNYYKDERKYKAYKNLYNWNVKKLFIHGDKDPYVKCSSSVNVSKKCKNSKLVVIEGGDHGFHKDECMIEALKETLKFINE